MSLVEVRWIVVGGEGEDLTYLVLVSICRTRYVHARRKNLIPFTSLAHRRFYNLGLCRTSRRPSIVAVMYATAE